MAKRNATVDLAKYIASILIVAIHTSVFSDIDKTLSFTVVDITCRVAVPFFAICSGYFITCRLEFGKTLQKSVSNRMVFWNQWNKLVRIYAVWTVIYLFHSIPMWIEIGWFSPHAFVDYVIGSVTKGSHYHFWYLWGMIYTLPVYYLFLRLCKRRYWEIAIVILWMLKALGYAYSRYIPAPFSIVLEKLGTFLCLLPLLAVGSVIAKQKQKSLGFYLTGFALSFVGLIAEAFILRHCGQNAVSYVFFTLPVAYFLFCLIVNLKTELKSELPRTLGAISLFIYCVHPILVELTDHIFQSTLIHFSFVTLGSTFLGFGYYYLRKRLKRKKVIPCSN